MVAGIAYAVWRTLSSRVAPDPTVGWEPQPFPYPPRPRERDTAVDPTTNGAGGGPGEGVSADGPPWVEAVDGACPASHPVKAKLASGIFHVPGGGNYDRTNADRCYLDAAAAERDGLRPSKR
jgi:hypothetical protein